MYKPKINKLKLILSFTLGTLFISCVPTIGEDILSEAHDNAAPTISNIIPDDGYAYGAYTTITGTVTDLNSDGKNGSVDSLTLEIVGISDPQVLEIDEEGHFSSGELTTYGDAYVGPITVKITATDWNGNTKEENISYSKSDGEITNFSIERGNKELTLTWDGLSDGNYVYTIKELYYGLGSKTLESGDGEVSYTWEDLENGKNYSFYISAESTTDETVLSSSLKSMMPLSPLNCTPVIALNSDSTDLLWPTLTDADKYVVQRSTSLNGSWETIGITSNNYLSYSETPGTPYFYHVYPYSTEAPLGDELIESLASTMGGARTGNSPASIDQKSSYSGGYKSIAVAGDYAYICCDEGLDNTKPTNIDLDLQILDISNPSSPTKVGSFYESGVIPMDITVNGNYGFLTCAGRNPADPDLIIFDLSDPSLPVKLSEISGRSDYFGLHSFLYGNYLYMLMDNNADTLYEGVSNRGVIGSDVYKSSWVIFDVTDPSSPTLLGYNTDITTSSDMIFTHHSVSGKDIALMNNDDQIVYYEMDDPLFLIDQSSNTLIPDFPPDIGTTNPVILGMMSYSDSHLHYFHKIDTTTPILGYVNISNTLSITAPNWKESGELAAEIEPANIYNMISLGDYTIFNSNKGLITYLHSELEDGTNLNLSDVLAVEVSGTEDTDTTYDVAVQGNYAYLAGTFGFIIFELK